MCRPSLASFFASALIAAGALAAPKAATAPPKPAAAAPADPLDKELERRGDELIKADFHYTSAFSLKRLTAAAPIRVELFVPSPGELHRFSFWADAASGSISFRLLGPDGKTLASWSGRSGEATLTLQAPVGRYQLQIDRIAGDDGRALFGVRGAVLGQCELKRGELQEHAAAPDNSFRFPYLLWLPTNLAARRLLVLPINTGFPTEDPALLRASATCDLDRAASLAERLGTPILIPLFPRPSLPDDTEDLDVHALSRAALETKIGVLRRIDLQLLAMIDDALAALGKRKPGFDSRVLLFGFSAAGMFSNRFAVLHPERVLAVAAGAPGGWPIAPTAESDGEKLTYPMGTADLDKLTGELPNPSALRRVSWFLFLGGEDQNDAVPYRDNFSKADEELIFRRFGKTPVSRWKAAEDLYRRAGIPAQFTLYKGQSHSMNAQMNEDVAKFFERAQQGSPPNTMVR